MKFVIEIYDKSKCIDQTTINGNLATLELDARLPSVLWLQGSSAGYKDLTFDPRIHTIKITVTYE